MPTSARQPADFNSTVVENDNQTAPKILSASLSIATAPDGKTPHQQYNYSDLEKVIETQMESIAERQANPVSTLCKSNIDGLDDERHDDDMDQSMDFNSDIKELMNNSGSMRVAS